MFQKDLKKIASVVLTVAILAASLPAYSLTAQAEEDQGGVKVTDGDSAVTDMGVDRLSTNYSTVSKRYTADRYCGEDIVFSMEDSIAGEDKTYLTEDV